MRGHIHNNQMSIAYRNPQGGRLGSAGDSAAVRGQDVQRTGEEGVGKQMGRRRANDLTGIMRCILCCGAMPLAWLLSETWFNLHVHFERAFSLKLCCGWDARIRQLNILWSPTLDFCSRQQRSTTQQDVKKQLDCCLIIYISCFIIKTWSSTFFLKISVRVCNMTILFSFIYIYLHVILISKAVTGQAERRGWVPWAGCYMQGAHGALGEQRVPVPW